MSKPDEHIEAITQLIRELLSQGYCFSAVNEYCGAGEYREGETIEGTAVDLTEIPLIPNFSKTNGL